MIVLKTKNELALMQIAGKISAGALQAGGAMIRPGVTTAQIGKAIHRYIKSKNATPSFLGYGGFPASACISVNDIVIHGIPGDYILREGDVVSIDVGAKYKGFHGDNAATFAVGKISSEAQRLLDVTRDSLYRGIEAAQNGARVGDISYAVESFVKPHGFGVVRKFVGHGVGREMHEAPEVPNFGARGKGARLTPGMTLAIEPMVNLDGCDVNILHDGWTVRTASGSISAHFEHTVAITKDGPVILTQL